MSEWQAHVHCTCFQDGLTTEPPYPRSDLVVNRFGIVTIVGSTDHSEDPEDLWDWRFGYNEDQAGSSRAEENFSPCAHDWMQLVCTHPFYPPAAWRRMERPYPQVEGMLSPTAFPLLNEIFHRHPTYDFASGGIWVTADEAAPALAELSRLLSDAPADLQDGDAYFLECLRTLLDASAETGNPVICHYNGIGDDAW